MGSHRPGGHPRRSAWSGALGSFAALPVAWSGPVAGPRVPGPLITGG
jgi:hypothetical protein